MPHSCVVVLTARGSGRILKEGGSQAWRINPQNADRAEYCVCVQNRKQGWGGADYPHHHAFMVGRIERVDPTDDRAGRFIIKFKEYALIDSPDAWDGNRNPVRYSTLEEFGITDPSNLDWKEMPQPKLQNMPKEIAEDEYDSGDFETPITIEEAKKRLARTFSVPESSIEINITF